MIYIAIKQQAFYCQMTPRGYQTKPIGKEIGEIQETLQPTLVTADQFIGKIALGYAFRAGEKRLVDFSQFQIITFDVDDCPNPMNSYIAELKYKPTMAYTTPSNSIDKGRGGIYRFRLVYVSDRLLFGKEKYDAVRDYIIQSNGSGLHHTDRKSYPAVHYFNGNATNIQTIITYNVYDFHEIRASSKRCNECTEEKGMEIQPLNLAARLGSYIKDTEFVADCCSLTMDGFLAKWLPIYLSSMNRIVCESPYIKGIHPLADVAPSDYQCVLRCKSWDPRKGKFTMRRWHDGENRHGKIYYAAQVVKCLNEITLDELIYWVVNEFVLFYNNRNGDGTIRYTLKTLIDTVILPAWELDQELLYSPKHSSIHVTDDAVSITGKTKRQLAPSIASEVRMQKIMKDYDNSISIAKNFERFKNRGEKISLRTLKRYRKKCEAVSSQ